MAGGTRCCKAGECISLCGTNEDAPGQLVGYQTARQLSGFENRFPAWDYLAKKKVKNTQRDGEAGYHRPNTIFVGFTQFLDRTTKPYEKILLLDDLRAVLPR